MVLQSLSKNRTMATSASANNSNEKNHPTQSEPSSVYSPYNSQPLTVFKSTDVPQFDALRDAAIPFVRLELNLRNLCNDSTRCLALRATYVSENDFRRIILDYSRQQVTGEIMELLFDMADAVGFATRQKTLQEEGVVSAPGSSPTPVLHHVLRIPMEDNTDNGGLPPPENDSRTNYNPSITQEILPEMQRCRRMVEDFTNQIRSGQHLGVTGKLLRNVLVVSDPVSRHGTECVYDALQRDATSKRAAQGRVLRFCTSVNPVDFETQTHDLDPSETLVVIILNQDGNNSADSERNSDEGEDLAILYNARSAEKWLIQNLRAVADVDADFSNTVGSTQSSFGSKSDNVILSKHMVVVASSSSKCMPLRASNYNESNNYDSNYLPSLLQRIEHVFDIGDNILNRFSVWSAIGLLPLSLQFSTVVTNQLLAGAYDLDQHFFQSPLRDNIPVLLGLLGMWNSTFLGYGVRAVLPYGLSNSFAEWVGQMDTESNGKHVAMDGEPILHYSSAEITIGANPAIYQVLHQGRVVPIDFVGFMESQLNQQNDSIQHDQLMSHFFAQPDALAYGKTMTELIQEGVPEELRPHKYLTGNRPSSSLLLSKLDAFGLGQLMAIYEHRTTVQGFLWGISSFDHTHGSEVANDLSGQIHKQLHYTRTTGASVQGFNPSTSTLLEEYLKHESTTTTTISSPPPKPNHRGGPVPYS